MPSMVSPKIAASCFSPWSNDRNICALHSHKESSRSAVSLVCRVMLQLWTMHPCVGCCRQGVCVRSCSHSAWPYVAMFHSELHILHSALLRRGGHQADQAPGFDPLTPSLGVAAHQSPFSILSNSSALCYPALEACHWKLGIVISYYASALTTHIAGRCHVRCTAAGSHVSALNEGRPSQQMCRAE